MDSKGTMRLAATIAIASALALAVAAGCSSKSNSSYNPTAPSPGKELSSGNIGAGAGFSHTFPAAGNFPYHCGIHPTIMFGDTVIVSDTETATSAAVTIVGVSTPGFSPATVSIKTGGTVTWTNGDAITHSVVSD